VLGDSREANTVFRAAYTLQPANPDVSHEYAQSCMALGLGKEAIDAARHAVTITPREAGLRSNLALGYLIAGETDDVRATIAAALSMDPRVMTFLGE
jgi:Flp pilus assembly protein TadD